LARTCAQGEWQKNRASGPWQLNCGLQEGEAAAKPVIAHPKREKARQGRFNRQTYRRRIVAARCINHLKWFRRVATHKNRMVTLSAIPCFICCYGEMTPVAESLDVQLRCACVG